MSWTFELAVVPVLIGPMQVLLAILPGLLIALGGALLALFRPRGMLQLARLIWRLKLPVVVIAGLVAVVVWATPGMFGASRAVTAAEATDASWSMFRGGPLRRGWADDGATDPIAGEPQWAFDDPVATFYATPTVVGNRVYITSADKGVYRDSGAIWCLDADTGGVVWRFEPDGFRATFSSPTVVGDRLVVGEGLHFTQDARVFCLDISDESNVRELWSYRTESHVESTPAVVDGRVYVGAGDDGYYCFGLEPDEEGKPVVLWHATGARYPDAESPPAVVDGKVFVGLGVDGDAVACLDAATGEELWRVSTPYPVFTAPTVVDGRVIVGMGVGNFVQTADQVRSTQLRKLQDEGASADEIAAARARLQPAGEVWSINTTDPDDRWTYDAGRVVLGAIAATDDSLYAVSRDGVVHRLSHAGRLIAKYESHEPSVSSPAVTEQHVYFVTKSGQLIALDRQTMQRAWSKSLGRGGMFLSSPTVGRGHVYVGSEGHGLLCLGRTNEGEKREVWAGAGAGPGVGGSIRPGSLGDQGAYLWRYPAPDASGQARPITVNAAPAAIGDRLYLPVAAGPDAGLLCLRNPEAARQTPELLWHAESPLGVHRSPAADPSIVLFVDGERGDTGRTLHAVDPEDGQSRWSHPVADDAPGIPALFGSDVFIADGARQLSCLDRSGERVWSAEVGRVVGMPDVRGAIVLVATAEPRTLTALDRVEGLVLWRMELDNAPTTGPVARGNQVFLGGRGSVQARRLVDGGLLWRSPLDSAPQPLTVRGGRIATATEDGRVLVFDAASGAVLADHSPATALPISAARNDLLYLSPDSLMRMSLEAPSEVSPWTDVSWFGRPAAQPIVVDGRVYLVTDERGLIRTGVWQ